MSPKKSSPTVDWSLRTPGTTPISSKKLSISCELFASMTSRRSVEPKTFWLHSALAWMAPTHVAGNRVPTPSKPGVWLVAMAPVPATTSSMDVFTGVDGADDAAGVGSPPLLPPLASTPTSTLTSRTFTKTRPIRSTFFLFIAHPPPFSFRRTSPQQHRKPWRYHPEPHTPYYWPQSPRTPR